MIIDKFKSGENVKFAFFGDSVTHGYFESFNGMHGTVDYEAVYHNRLKGLILDEFPTASVEIINAGVGGENAQDALLRIDEDVLARLPDLTVVCFGLNDVHGNIDTYISSLKEIFIKLNSINTEIVFMTPNMLNSYLDDSLSGALRNIAIKTAEYQTSGKMSEFMARAIELCRAMNVTVCDCYSAWEEMHKNGVDTTALLANKINHPKREMHKLFANELFKIIIER